MKLFVCSPSPHPVLFGFGFDREDHVIGVWGSPSFVKSGIFSQFQVQICFLLGKLQFLSLSVSRDQKQLSPQLKAERKLRLPQREYLSVWSSAKEECFRDGVHSLGGTASRCACAPRWPDHDCSSLARVSCVSYKGGVHFRCGVSG